VELIPKQWSRDPQPLRVIAFLLTIPHFRSDLGRDRVLTMVLLFMDQRYDLGNYLREKAARNICRADAADGTLQRGPAVA